MKIITIDIQCWMAENLDINHFRNGDLLLEANTSEQWISAGEKGIGAWCYYDYNPLNGKEYGKLYNWFAVIDPRGLAPEGWHVSTEDEWNILENYLGGRMKGGAELKEIGTMHWKSPNTGASDKFGFRGLPGGINYHYDGFAGLGYFGIWWLPSDIKNRLGNILMFYDSKSTGIKMISPGTGLSVRCIKDQ